MATCGFGVLLVVVATVVPFPAHLAFPPLGFEAATGASPRGHDKCLAKVRIIAWLILRFLFPCYSLQHDVWIEDGVLDLHVGLSFRAFGLSSAGGVLSLALVALVSFPAFVGGRGFRGWLLIVLRFFFFLFGLVELLGP